METFNALAAFRLNFETLHRLRRNRCEASPERLCLESWRVTSPQDIVWPLKHLLQDPGDRKGCCTYERRQYKLKGYIIEVMYIEKYAKLGVFLVFLPTKPESMNRKKKEPRVYVDTSLIIKRTLLVKSKGLLTQLLGDLMISWSLPMVVPLDKSNHVETDVLVRSDSEIHNVWPMKQNIQAQIAEIRASLAIFFSPQPKITYHHSCIAACFF